MYIYESNWLVQLSRQHTMKKHLDCVYLNNGGENATAEFNWIVFAIHVYEVWEPVGI